MQCLTFLIETEVAKQKIMLCINRVVLRVSNILILPISA